MILKQGSRGQAVLDYQQKLLGLKYNIKADGIFGPNTRSVTMRFQKDHGLAADGIAGPQTLGRIESETSGKLETGIGKRYIVTAGGLNLRKGAGSASRLIRAVRQGETCEGLDSGSGGYIKIRMDADGLAGYGWAKRLAPCNTGGTDPQHNDIPHTGHFTTAQWETRCSITDQALYPILQTLMNALEILRERSGGREIVIHSGYRTKKYHQSLNPGTNSMHCFAGAADISFGGDTSKKGMREIGILARELYDEGVFGGIGLGNSCVHVDVRGRADINGKTIRYDNLRAMWFYNGYKNYEAWLDGTI